MNYYYCPICSIVLTDVTEDLSLRAMLGMKVIPPIEVTVTERPMKLPEPLIGLTADDFEVSKKIYLCCKYYLVKGRISDFKEITGNGRYSFMVK